MIRFPYRWTWRTAWKNVCHPYYDIKSGLRNLWRFRSAVWWYRSFDYSGLLELMEVALRDMRDGTRKYGLSANREKHIRQMTIAMELCRRLHEDDYFERAGYDEKAWPTYSDAKRTRIAQHSDYLSTQDAAYLGKQLRFVQYWWE